MHLFLVDLEGEVCFGQQHKNSEGAGSRGAEGKVIATAFFFFFWLRQKRDDSPLLHFKICLVWVVIFLFLPVTPHWCCPSDNSAWCSQRCPVLRLEAMLWGRWTAADVGVGVARCKSLPPRTAPTPKGWEGCFVCEQQREKMFGLSVETLGG